MERQKIWKILINGDLEKIDSILLVIQSAKELSTKKMNGFIKKKKLPIEGVQIYTKYNSTNQNIPYKVDIYLEIRKKIDELVSGISQLWSDEKIFAEIYKRIATRISFDNEDYSEEDINFKNSRNLINALFYQKTVCAGYSEVLRNALDLKGIESVKVSGDVIDKDGAHEWNKVKIDGKWYNADLTWDREYLVLGEIPEFALKSDEEFSKTLLEVLEKLPPMEISERYGTIREWIKDYEETDPGHRHISHLFGLFPGDQINESNPEIYEAAKRTIARRIENGGGSTGWSRAWTICFYTRLKDGENSYKHLKYLLEKCTANNLFDIHPPFQIDGNFGGVAAITEMLLQSHLGSPDSRVAEVLPALPNDWNKGCIKGIRARGNLTFDISWENSILKIASVTAENDCILRIKLNNKTENLKANKYYIIEDNCLKTELSAGETIELTN